MKQRLTIIFLVLFRVIECLEAQVIANRFEFSIQAGYLEPVGVKEVRKNVNGDYSYAEPLLFSNMQGIPYASFKLNYMINKVFDIGFRYDSPKTFSNWSSQANLKHQNSSVQLREMLIVLGIKRSFRKVELSIGFLSGLSLIEYKNEPSNYWIYTIKQESESIPPNSLILYNLNEFESIVSPSFGVELGAEFYLDQNLNVDLDIGYNHRVVVYSDAYSDSGFQSLCINLGLCFRLFKDKKFLYR